MSLYNIQSAKPLQNDMYYYHLIKTIESSKTRIWVSMFSINLLYTNDDSLRTRKLINCLLTAKNRGVDVRIVIGAGKEKHNLFDTSNLISEKYLNQISLISKFYAKKNKSSHSKYVLVDNDIIILGSHNFGHRSLRVGNDDSVEIKSIEFNKYLESNFLEKWEQ